MTEKKGKSLLDIGYVQTRQAARLFSSQEQSISKLRQALKWEISDEDRARIQENLRASQKTLSRIDGVLHMALNGEEVDSVHKKLH